MSSLIQLEEKRVGTWKNCIEEGKKKKPDLQHGLDERLFLLSYEKFWPQKVGEQKKFYFKRKERRGGERDSAAEPTARETKNQVFEKEKDPPCFSSSDQKEDRTFGSLKNFWEKERVHLGTREEGRFTFEAKTGRYIVRPFLWEKKGFEAPSRGNCPR